MKTSSTYSQQASESKAEWNNVLDFLSIAGIPFLYCYFIFFAFHDVILNIHRPSDAMIAQVLDPHNVFGGNDQHDGIEPYVLFLMTFITGPLGFLLYCSSFPKKILKVIGIILWVVFFFELHFFQKVLSINGAGILKAMLAIGVFAALVALLKWVYDKNSLVGQFLVAELTIIICFIPYCNISYFDYSFLLAPALRWLQTGKISETFFQYDILPSLPALFILKNNYSVYAYRYAAEGSMLLFLLGMFITARKFLQHKSLAFALLVLAVMIRFFMGLSDVTFSVQSTAIRLDWWLFLFAFAFFWGLADKKLGLVLFILLVLINQWGVIYFVCYGLVLFFLFITEAFVIFSKKGTPFQLTDLVTGYLKKYGPNILISLLGMLTFRILTGGFIDESVKFFGGFQIGMLPIEQTSLFWYFAAIFAFTATLLLRFRNQFTERYFTSAIFLLALSAGSCMYFFGRSHENNVIHVSGSLLFVTVLCCDILRTISTSYSESVKGINRYISSTPIVLILLVFALNNGQAFANNGSAFLSTLKNGPWSYEEELPEPGDMENIKAITQNNPKVYFMTIGLDFYLYYRGGYNLPAKINPIQSWCVYREQIDFANQKLAEGYSIVALSNDVVFKRDFIPKLRFSKTAEKAGYIALSN